MVWVLTFALQSSSLLPPFICREVYFSLFTFVASLCMISGLPHYTFVDHFGRWLSNCKAETCFHCLLLFPYMYFPTIMCTTSFSLPVQRLVFGKSFWCIDQIKTSENRNNNRITSWSWRELRHFLLCCCVCWIFLRSCCECSGCGRVKYVFWKSIFFDFPAFSHV